MDPALARRLDSMEARIAALESALDEVRIFRAEPTPAVPGAPQPTPTEPLAPVEVPATPPRPPVLPTTGRPQGRTPRPIVGQTPADFRRRALERTR